MNPSHCFKCLTASFLYLSFQRSSTGHLKNKNNGLFAGLFDHLDNSIFQKYLLPKAAHYS
jgi:hypothetical protein